MNDIFKALYTIPEEKVKVVILGQDPYHNGSAVGLAFSVPEGKTINPSLINIKKEVENCGYKTNPKSGNLFPWTKQGVLLINTALTVEEGYPESQLTIWKDFTKTSHPSPLGANRGFLGSKCFIEANEYLLSINKEKIDWSIL